MTKSRNAHAAAKPRSSVASKIVGTAGIFSLAIVLALSATGGSYALWRDSAEVNAPSLTSGSIGLTINGASDVAVDMTTTRLWPGRSVVSASPLLVKNTGTTPLSVTAATPTFSSPDSAIAAHLTVALRPAVTCTTSPAGAPPIALPASMGETPLVLAPGGEARLCLEVSLSATAPREVQGTTAVFSIRLTGAQVPRS